MDVGVWLEALGLGQYAQAFAENNIDFTVLTHLTDADLKELGVAFLGHHKRLLTAIAGRGAEVPAAAAPGRPGHDSGLSIPWVAIV